MTLRTLGTQLKEDGIFHVEVLRVHRLQEGPGEIVNVIEFVRESGELNFVLLPWSPRDDAFFYRSLPLRCTLVSIRRGRRELGVHFTRGDWSAVASLIDKPRMGV